MYSNIHTNVQWHFIKHFFYQAGHLNTSAKKCFCHIITKSLLLRFKDNTEDFFFLQTKTSWHPVRPP